MDRLFLWLKKWSGHDFFMRHVRVLRLYGWLVFAVGLSFIGYERLSDGAIVVIAHCGDFQAVGGYEYNDFMACSIDVPKGCSCSRVDGPYLFLGKATWWYVGNP
jgi:hypothetical protein